MRWFALLLAFAFALAPPANAPQGLAQEMDRIRAEAAAGTPEDQRATPAARLERARAALEAGRPLLALYLFEMPWESAKAWTFVQASATVTTPAAFAKKWTAMGEPRASTAGPGGRRPVLAEALASAADARGAATYHASRAFADDADVPAGFYYLGESHAVVQFAAFARSLDWPVPAPAPPLRAITAELNALDTEMTTAYEKMDRSNHPTYIQASAALKQAKTLNARGQYAGALFQYLLSTYLFAPLRGPGIAHEATAAQMADARHALPPGVDHSIAEMFLQLAGEGTTSTVAAQRLGSGVVLDVVLPAYLRAIGQDGRSTTAPVSAEVTITLVRWPFT
jgi:hypothetical protein